MSWWFTGGGDTVMAGVAGADDGSVVYSEYAAERNRVMAIFTVICAGDVPGWFADSYAAVMTVLARFHDITVVVYRTCP